MTSSFRYDDLPVELKLKVLEHVFTSHKGSPPIHVRALDVRKTISYRLCDEYFDTFYDCIIPSELTLFPDPSFRQLFVSKDYLRTAIPIFASQNRIEIRLNSYRTVTSESIESCVVQQTLKDILWHVREVTITHTLLARDNHLDTQHLLTLISPPRLRECNLVIEKPRFWFRNHPDLRTAIVGHLLNFAFKQNGDLRLLSEKEVFDLRDNKLLPVGFLDLLQANHAPSEVTWHREDLIPTLRRHGFEGTAWLQIDIVVCRNSITQIPFMPISCLLRFDSTSLTLLEVLLECIGHRFWSRKRGRYSGG